MTATTDDVELHECACGCGELVKGKYARGHWARAQAARRGLTPLPGPDDVPADDDEDLPAELVAELDELDQDLSWIDQAPPPGRGPRPTDEPADDPPPARIPPPRTRQAPTTGTRRVRATAAVQKDVHAKIRMVLMPAGRFWQMRDPLCGGTFVEQEPDISSALAEIVCDSPDLLNWFTGPAGGYMKYFNLTMAVWPVLMTVTMHHITHAQTVDQPVDGQQPQQMQNYAA